jgi:putative ABC transport system ATP-binding protein
MRPDIPKPDVRGPESGVNTWTPDSGLRTSDPCLVGRNLSRSFGKGETLTHALCDVSLELYRGEVALLMGPSGSGKSTLLAVLSGLLRPTSGEVVALGQDLGALSEVERERFRLRHCGFIFQGINLFPMLTAREQLEMVVRWGEGTSLREAARRVEAMLDLLELSRRGDLRADQLSGGEKQRVAVGRALLKEPTFCFADEPTSSLDWAHGEQVVRLLRTAARERGATVLMVGHDPRLVPFADRVFCIADGRLVSPAPAPRSVQP